MMINNSKNSIYKKTLLLAIPMMIQMGITNAVGLIDNIMVGSLGTESITGVSIGGQLIFVFNLAIFGGMSGPGIFGAQYYGKGDKEGVQSIFRLKWWIAIAITVAGLFVFTMFGEQLITLYLHGESADIDPDITVSEGMQYLGIMLGGFLPLAITQVYSSQLRETGESVRPMVAGIVSVMTDIVFNYILIYGKFGAPKMGVRGAAIATVISRFVEMAVLVISAHLHTDKHTFLKGIYRKIRVPRRILLPVLAKSWPMFINEFMWAGGMAVLTQCYSLRGLSVVAGLNISNALCNLLNVVFIAMGHAVGIIVGQMLGASDYDGAEKSGLRLSRFTGCLSAVLTVILIALAWKFPLIYDTSAEVRHIATRFIVITALFFPVQGFLNAMYFTLRSGGKTVITMLFDSVYTWCAGVLTAFVLCHFTSLSVFVIYAIVQTLDILKCVIGYVLLKKKIWLVNIT